MIKINVIVSNNNWFNYIKKPNYYLERKIYKLNLKEKKLLNVRKNADAKIRKM